MKFLAPKELPRKQELKIFAFCNTSMSKLLSQKVSCHFFRVFQLPLVLNLATTFFMVSLRTVCLPLWLANLL